MARSNARLIAAAPDMSENSKSVMKRLLTQMGAYELGKKQAGQGFGKNDYPMFATEAEREAWQRGWDEYMENRNA